MDWKITNSLPKQGGTLDQDAEFMRDFRVIVHIESTLEKNKTQVAEVQKQLADNKGAVKKL
jgi:hypothetical protein